METDHISNTMSNFIGCVEQMCILKCDAADVFDVAANADWVQLHEKVLSDCFLTVLSGWSDCCLTAGVHVFDRTRPDAAAMAKAVQLLEGLLATPVIGFAGLSDSFGACV